MRQIQKKRPVDGGGNPGKKDGFTNRASEIPNLDDIFEEAAELEKTEIKKPQPRKSTCGCGW